MEIWLRRKLKGYVDQYTILADMEGLSSKNMKLAITKRNIADSLKYCPERQYKFIAFNVGFFSETVWKIISPLLPKKTLLKVSLLGKDAG